jgi:hypothetical protein
MDRGVQERKVAESLRDAVKKELSLQRLTRQSRGADGMRSDEPLVSQQRNGLYLYDISSTANDIVNADPFPVGEVSPANPNQVTLPSDESSNPKAFESSRLTQTLTAAAIADATRNDAINIILTKDSWSVLPIQFEEDQASLLMHFFDHVLPLQFRFYNPSILEGGRGWLLSFLTRIKPLYNVVLSLAAYHQQSVLVRETGISCTASLTKLQERHIECIRVLRHYLADISDRAKGHTCEETVDIMASIAMLIALEVSLSKS